MKGGKEIKGNRKVEHGVKNEGARNEEAFTQCKKGSAGKIMGEISRRSARSMGKYRMERGKSEFRG